MIITPHLKCVVALGYLWKVKVQICDKLHNRSTFSRSVMVSVGISKLNLTDIIIFVHQRVKINGGYYSDMLLSQQLLPVMRDVSGDFFIFQRHSAPAHRARDTVRFLEQSTSIDLWPPNSVDLNPVDYKMEYTMWGFVYNLLLFLTVKEC